MGFDAISACYALSVAAGGIVGYVKAGSTNSLFAGLAFGCILGYGAYQTSIDEKNFLLSLMATCTLGGVMGVRFYNSGKFMPAGLMTIMRYQFGRDLCPIMEVIVSIQSDKVLNWGWFCVLGVMICVDLQNIQKFQHKRYCNR